MISLQEQKTVQLYTIRGFLAGKMVAALELKYYLVLILSEI